MPCAAQATNDLDLNTTEVVNLLCIVQATNGLNLNTIEVVNVLGTAQATNDLDLNTIEAVQALLQEYKGVLLVVSHDRAFVEAVAERLFVLRGDGLVRLFDGPYSEVRCFGNGPSETSLRAAEVAGAGQSSKKTRSDADPACGLLQQAVPSLPPILEARCVARQDVPAQESHAVHAVVLRLSNVIEQQHGRGAKPC